MFEIFSRTEPVKVPAAPGHPAANGDATSTLQLARLKRFPLRFEAYNRWMAQFLHGRK